MKYPDKLKINKFHKVRIPSKHEYFNTGRYMADTGTYGGEEEAAPRDENKIETLEKVVLDLEERHENDLP